MKLKLPKDVISGGTFVVGEKVVAVQFVSFYSKQDKEREQSSDFELKKTIGTDRTQLSEGSSGQEHKTI